MDVIFLIPGRLEIMMALLGDAEQRFVFEDEFSVENDHAFAAEKTRFSLALGRAFRKSAVLTIRQLLPTFEVVTGPDGESLRIQHRNLFGVWIETDQWIPMPSFHLREGFGPDPATGQPALEPYASFPEFPLIPGVRYDQEQPFS